MLLDTHITLFSDLPQKHNLIDTLKAGFHDLGTINILDGLILQPLRGCSVHCKMFSGIPSFYPTDASSTPSPAVTTENISRHDQHLPADKIILVKNHYSKALIHLLWAFRKKNELKIQPNL